MNTVDHRGWTPLIISVHHGHTEIVKVLLENKADLESKD